jgi:hypothetical protein
VKTQEESKKKFAGGARNINGAPEYGRRGELRAQFVEMTNIAPPLASLPFASFPNQVESTRYSGENKEYVLLFL